MTLDLDQLDASLREARHSACATDAERDELLTLIGRVRRLEAVTVAAREALSEWVRMSDAALTDDDPRRAWWFETGPARDALRAALAVVDAPEPEGDKR